MEDNLSNFDLSEFLVSKGFRPTFGKRYGLSNGNIVIYPKLQYLPILIFIDGVSVDMTENQLVSLLRI